MHECVLSFVRSPQAGLLLPGSALAHDSRFRVHAVYAVGPRDAPAQTRAGDTARRLGRDHFLM